MDDPRPRLPDVTLPPLDGGEPVPVRMRRQATVLVLLPAALREGDAEYLAELAQAEPAFREWDGRVFGIVADDGPSPALPPVARALPLLQDATGRVARAAGVTAPALLVTDQWGEVHVRESADGAPWYPVREVEQTLRWLAIRCAG